MKLIQWCIFLGLLVSALAALRPVPYRDVQSIVLQAGKTAVGRRSSVPQMVNVGPSYPSDVLPTTIQCSNKGWDGSQYTWHCQAQLPDGVDFARTEVSCENWEPPVHDAQPDDVMTAGSCGVEYALKGVVTRPTQTHHEYRSTTTYDDGNDVFGVIIAFFVVVVVIIAVVKCISECEHPARTVHVSSTPVYTSAPPAPTVHVTTSSSDSGFWNGWLWGSLSRPSSTSHVYHHNAPSSSWSWSGSSSSSSSSSGRSSSGGSHASSSFSGTKRR